MSVWVTEFKAVKLITLHRRKWIVGFCAGTGYASTSCLKAERAEVALGHRQCPWAWRCTAPAHLGVWQPRRGAELPCGVTARVVWCHSTCGAAGAAVPAQCGGWSENRSFLEGRVRCWQVQAHSETSQYLQFYFLPLVWTCCFFLN